VKVPIGTSQVHHVYNQFTIYSSERDTLREHPRGRGIPCAIYYPIHPILLHLQKAFAYLGHKAGEFLASEAASCEVHPELTEEQHPALERHLEPVVTLQW
jgi:UDP-2-acetamido-2-deoxy-ribo-hexuluronate aminotransferase